MNSEDSIFAGMKILLLLLTLSLSANLYAQSDPSQDPELCRHIAKTINFIKKKDAKALSKVVN